MNQKRKNDDSEEGGRKKFSAMNQKEIKNEKREKNLENKNTNGYEDELFEFFKKENCTSTEVLDSLSINDNSV